MIQDIFPYDNYFAPTNYMYTCSPGPRAWYLCYMYRYLIGSFFLNSVIQHVRQTKIWCGTMESICPWFLYTKTWFASDTVPGMLQPPQIRPSDSSTRSQGSQFFWRWGLVASCLMAHTHVQAILIHWRPTLLRHPTYTAQRIKNDLFHARDYGGWGGGCDPAQQAWLELYHHVKLNPTV